MYVNDLEQQDHLLFNQKLTPYVRTFCLFCEEQTINTTTTLLLVYNRKTSKVTAACLICLTVSNRLEISSSKSMFLIALL